MEPGHNGEPGALVARLVEEDLKLVRAPVAQHHRAVWAAVSSHSSAGPEGVQVNSFFFFFSDSEPLMLFSNLQTSPTMFTCLPYVAWGLTL